MVKVLFTTNIPSPYRVDFFNELAKHVDLTVWFFWEKGMENRPWTFKDAEHKYKYEVLKELKISRFRINPTLYSELRENDFDIIIVGGYSLLSEMLLITYLKKKQIPFVLNSDGGFINNRNIFIERLKHWLISSANYWLASGEQCAETLTHYGAIPEKIFKYYFSSYKNEDIRTTTISQEERLKLRKQMGLPLNNFIVITVGQYIQRKGIDIFIECAKELIDCNYTFITIGQGPLKGEYERFIRENSLTNIMILEHMDKADLIKHYLAADLFVLPTREDIWGLVLNEAISCGLPVIASDKTGAAYDLINGNGFMVPLNAAEISKKIKLILTDKKLREDCSRRSLMIAKEYTIEKMVDAHLKLFRSLKR